MKKSTIVCAVLAAGLLSASLPVAAQQVMQNPQTAGASVQETSQGQNARATTTKTVEINGVTLKGNDTDGYTVTKYSGNAIKVDLTTEEFKDYKITTIGENVFSTYNNLIDNLIEVVLPDTVQVINKYAFDGCDKLQTCNMPKELKSIGNGAFRGSAIKEVSIPATCTLIGGYAFSDCGNLKTMSFEARKDELTFGLSCLSYCTSLKELSIPEGITALPKCFCKGSTSLTKVELPSTCTSIEESAFENCSKLEQVTIPDDCKTLGKWAFYNTAITSAKIPATINLLPQSVFKDCNKLKEVVFAERTTKISIEETVFSGCSALTSIVLPQQCSAIGASTFSGCSALTSITLPEDLEIIEDGTFDGCAKLSKVELPKKCRAIGESVFLGCSSLKELTIPAECETIGAFAFQGCNALTKLVFKNGDTTVSMNNNLGVDKRKFIIESELGGAVEDFAKEKGFMIQCKSEEISITELPRKTEYFYGEDLALDGIVVSAKLITQQGDQMKNIELGNCMVSGFDSKKVGQQEITIAYGGASASFPVFSYYDMSRMWISCDDTEYTGEACIPTVRITNGAITLTADDYSIKCTNNNRVGTANITITGRNNYRGVVEKTFAITKKSIRNAVITLEKDIYAYDGRIKNPVITVTLDGKVLIKNVDYSVSYTNNIYAGNATVTVVGMGNYTDAASKDYKINVLPGTSHVVGAYKYKVINDKEVTLVSMTNKKDTLISVPASIVISGKSFKVTAIADKAFKGTEATKITIGKNITKIGKQAFYKAKKLQTLTIKSKKLKSVGKNAFKGINAKAKIKVPKSKLSAYKKLLKKKGQSKKVKIVKY